MATEKPQFISPSQRLRIEQKIFWLERIALFLLFTVSCSISVENLSLDQREENSLTSTRIVTALIIILITLTNALYLEWRKEMPDNINPNPNVKTEAKAHAERLLEERIAFWIERLAITFLFCLFFLLKKARIGIIWAMAVTASFFILSNFAYLLLFLASEELYVQINNIATFIKESNQGGKGSQSCTNTCESGSSSNSGSKEMCDQQALKEARDESWKLKTECENLKAFHIEEARDESWKLKTEYENLEAFHIEESRKGIKQCKLKYRMQFKEKEDKLEEKYNEAIEECKKYYQMKLKEKEDKWKENLKKMKDEHKEDHQRWEEEKIHFATKLIVENIRALSAYFTR